MCFIYIKKQVLYLDKIIINANLDTFAIIQLCLVGGLLGLAKDSTITLRHVSRYIFWSHIWLNIFKKKIDALLCVCFSISYAILSSPVSTVLLHHELVIQSRQLKEQFPVSFLEYFLSLATCTASFFSITIGKWSLPLRSSMTVHWLYHQGFRFSIYSDQ